MKITIIYDNTVFEGNLKSDWGFSSLVEVKDRNILFDTGANGSILLSNMRELGVDPDEVDEVFISHNHHDHTGGLPAFLEENNQVKVWAPPSFRFPGSAAKVGTIEGATELHDGIYSTGELERIEQSLCLRTQKGIVVVAGCSHPKMSSILGKASEFGEVYGIIGGLHGTPAEALEGLELICATHCTQHKAEMRKLYPEQYLEGGAGRIIEL